MLIHDDLVDEARRCCAGFHLGLVGSGLANMS
jgi:hypothetical protein